MSLSIAIVGLPNVGKSTLFNGLTKSQVLAANYPFATIEPNVGIVPVPDEQLDILSNISKSAKTVPAVVKFVDVAGLVRGAAQGAGLGNKFLAHIRECSAIAQVVRVFDDGDVTHVDESVDPARDIETIRMELALADIATIQNRLSRIEKELKANPKAAQDKKILEQAMELLNQGKLLYDHLTEIPAVLSELGLLTTKPFIYVFNIDEQSLSNKQKKDKLQELVEGAPVVFLSATLEMSLTDMGDSERDELLRELGQAESGLSALARKSYEILGLQSYYTSGEKESRAWTVHQGATAPEAAGVIHTDFERGFIKADVVSYNDFVACSGWVNARNTGKVRLEGRDYVMRPDDVVEFKFNI